MLNPIRRDDVIGIRIAEVIVSAPDRPVSMADVSTSQGYVRLENGVVLDLGAVPPLHPVDARALRLTVRDKVAEKEFQGIIGQKVVDVRFDPLLYILIEGGQMISIVPAQFWVCPVLENVESMDPDARSIWSAS